MESARNATYDEERSWNQMLGYGAHPLKQELHFVLMHFSLGKQAPECFSIWHSGPGVELARLVTCLRPPSILSIAHVLAGSRQPA